MNEQTDLELIQKDRDNNVLLNICYIIFSLIVFCPIVDYYCNWMVTGLFLILIFLMLAKKIENVMAFIIPFALIIALVLLLYFAQWKDKEFFKIITDNVIYLTPAPLAYLTYKYNNKYFTNILSHFALGAIAFTSVTSIIGYEKYPFASRELASGTALYDTERYTLLNIGGYDFIYLCVLAIPFTFFLIKYDEGKRLRIFDIVCLVINTFCIYKSQYSIALIVTVAIYITIIFFKNKKVGTLILIVFLILLVTNGFDYISRGLYSLAEVDESEYVSNKLRIIGDVISGNTNVDDTGNRRIALYLKALRSFWRSPIIGTNLFSFDRERISGHSLYMDILASFGLVGFAIYNYLFALLIKVVNGMRKVHYYTLVTYGFFFVLSVLNTVSFMGIYYILFMTPAFINILSGIDYDGVTEKSIDSLHEGEEAELC